MSDKIKFAVVGCGHIGKRHAEMIRRNPDCELVALVDVDDPVKLGVHHLGIPFFNSLDAFLASGISADVVNVATPNGIHAEQGNKVLNAGMHLVIEKPMALSGADAQTLISTAKTAEKEIFCVMQNRYSPPSVWLKELLESGKLGKIFMVQVNCFWNRDERYYSPDSWHGKLDMDGGTLFTQFSHFIDLLYWYFGDISNVQAKFADFNHADTTEFEDSGIVFFDFVNGGMGSLNYSTAVWDKNLESSITIIAENGSVKVGGQYMNCVEYCHIKDYRLPEISAASPENDYGNYKGSAANHHFVIDNVVRVLRGEPDTESLSDDGLKVVEIIEKIYRQKK